MADTKISALPASTTPLTGTEVLPVVQSGTTKQVSVANLTAGRAVSALSTTVTGNSILNGALASDVGLLKNIGRGYGVASDRWIGSDGTFTTWFYNVPTGGNHYFAINNVNKLTVVGDNVNIPDGNLVPGTAAKGVNFTANTPAAGMTSQLLNWYEEGTWTPSLGGNATYTNRTARYTRIGRQVTLSCDMTVNVIGTGSTTLISGVPFSAGAFFNAGSVSYWSGTNGNYTYITPMLSYGDIQFNTTASAVSAVSDTSAIFTSGTRVIFTLTYFV